jgi:siroheme synthase
MKRNAKVAIIQSGTTEKQRVVKGTLGTIVRIAETANVGPPAVIVIGSVAALNKDLSWFNPT